MLERVVTKVPKFLQLSMDAAASTWIPHSSEPWAGVPSLRALLTG